ncbi:2Fe-2S iron-sulfur cluster binding domain-containing protein [Patulibacter medicamentivorans]|uniref:2Fe-2S iron-sulfur cluster binding domain-containing protein n=1 Tax=Patulibacter medicamentivorans TaxID=1097667 RepID=UPI00058EC100|nr:2Fe-2S iron-sulfur cluster binding domain-containing protein [Patulibacter medicamentivorans]
MSPVIKFEPIGIEVECDEDETVLDASFREGWNLVHGCREGQCTACKSFLLEGEVSLEPYSTHALSESEEAQGYTLLCRAMPDSDLVVELLHFDPDNLRLAHPIGDGRARVAAIEELTAEIVRLRLEVLEPAGFSFTPGQYVDLWVPGTDGDERRSYSLANLPGDGVLELVIRRYAGGRFSGMVGVAGQVGVGDELRFTGPYGTMALRPGERPVLLVAGGSGIGPILSLLRELAAAGTARPVRFLYGARREADLPLREEIAELGAQLADFAFVPVLSEQSWDGATGLVHEAAARLVADGELVDPVVCTCGPPPMIEALIAVLTGRHGIAEGDIAFDKFTTAAAGETV